MNDLENDKNKKINLKKLATDYLNAAIENAKIANELVKSLQNWLLIFAIAELTFLGSLLAVQFDHTQLILSIPIIKLITIAFWFSLINFIFFILGCKYQHSHVLRIARAYKKLSDDAKEFTQKFQVEVEELPAFLKEQDLSAMHTNKWANRFFLGSILCVFVTTLIIILIFPFLIK